MIEMIKKILEQNNHISGWKIHESHVASEELFFIKKAVDMNRSKTVRHYTVTVYVDFKDDNEKYTGMASTSIHPTMNEQEIREVIDEAAFAASFVKNKAFPMVTSQSHKSISAIDRLSRSELIEAAIKISDKLYKQDNFEKGYINSSEVFVNRSYHRIINSKDVNVSYVSNTCEVEMITQWKENGQDVEIYDMYYFTDYDDQFIESKIKEQLVKTRDKVNAKPMPLIKNIPIIISGEAVKDIFNYYVIQGNAQMVYEGISQTKVGTCVQGEVRGDYVNIKLNPFMENSTLSSPVDEDGMILNEVQLYTDGVLNTYFGSTQYSSYLEIEPTGNMENFQVKEGSKKYSDLIKSPHIELLSFSDFEMNFVTGDFGGEIRLARYFDGEKSTPLTGGSLSANIKTIHENMYFTKEIAQINNYKGPKALTFIGDIAGAE